MKKSAIGIFLLLFIFVFSVRAVDKIELKKLDGNWEGEGNFLLPGVHTKIDIEGKAIFRFDKKTNRLRTELTGEKFMFSYSDSGYISINPKTDSVSWEVWDNKNRHAKYYGIRKGNMIHGERMRKDEIYEVKIVQTSEDKIEFKLIITEPDGDVFDKAVFELNRVK